MVDIIMTQLAIQDIVKIAQKAGFTDESLVVAVSIALAESGGNTTARNVNGPTSGCPNGSTDKGLWQINDCYHNEVSELCADTPSCAAQQAYKISNNGTNFHPWSTFLNGAYQQHVDAVRQAINSMPDEKVTEQEAQADIDRINQVIHNRLTELEKYVQQHQEGPPPQPVVHGQHYHTVAGDTLWSIALRFYHDGNKWNQIYAANKGVIGSDPNTIKADLTLVIP